MVESISKDDKLLTEIFSQTFKYDELKIHIILYSSSKAFQFNPISFSIRPLNSILWFNLDMDELFNVYTYMKYLYDIYSISSDASSLGECSGSLVSISLPKLYKDIDTKKDLFFKSLSVIKSGLKNEFDDFTRTIYNIYNKGEL